MWKVLRGIFLSSQFTLFEVDLWALHELGWWAVIPTNLQVRSNGEAVMGAGLAKAAAARFPELPAAYGRYLADGKRRMAKRDLRLILAPSKHHWKEDADLELIEESCRAIGDYARADDMVIAMPPFGCGLGGLDWQEIHPLVMEWLNLPHGKVYLLKGQ